jgi:hypothetical protein
MIVQPVFQTALRERYNRTLKSATPLPDLSPVWEQDAYIPSADPPNPVYNNTGTAQEARQGLSDDDLFAAIVRKHGGGATDETFSAMITELCLSGLITEDEQMVIGRAYVEKNLEARRREVGRLGHAYDFNAFIQSYRFSFDDLLSELMDLRKYSTTINDNMDTIREFAEKAAAAMKTTG